MAGNLTAMIAAIFSGSAVSTDPYFNLTTLLLSTTATNGQQNNTFQDSSTNNFTITRNPATGPNAPTQGTFSPFSQTGWGNYFDGTGDYLSNASNSIVPTTGDFTIEGWFYPSQVSTIQYIFATGGGTRIDVYINSSAYVGVQTGGSYRDSSTTKIIANAWNYIAITRTGSTYAIFVNGVSQTIAGTGTMASTITNTPTYIGTYSGTTNNFTGYICGLRVSTVVRTGLTTLPTSLYTSDASTSLLTCQSNRFIDNSTNNFTITPNGNTSVVPFSPFNPTSAWSASTVGGSGYFDGTGDYLRTPSNTALAMGTGDFQIEFWAYHTSIPASFTYIDTRPSGTNGPYITLAYNSSPNGIFLYVNAALISTGLTPVANAWTHFVLSRVGSTTRLFMNGSQIGSASDGTNYAIGANGMGIGGNTIDVGSYFFGYMAGFRVVKGSGVTSVTVPSTPPTAITNTSLLLSFTNAGIYDATAKNVLETVGNAQVSTAQSKWSPTSMYFDGTGDYLLIPDNPSQRIGTGNFTVECWVYRNASGTYGLIGKGTGTTGWLLSLNSSNQVVFTYGSSTITSTGTISATTWTHIAVVRSGTGANLTKIYISGTNDGTGTVSTDFNQTNAMYVAADRTGGSNANAYVQDTRVTLYARYSANFTPPTAAFPVQ